MTGTIVSVSEHAFGFRPENGSDTVYVDYDHVQRIDVSQGRRHRVLRDAVFGGIAGIVIGGVIGAASHPNFPSSEVVIPPGDTSEGGCTIRDTDCAEPDPAPHEPTIIHREPTGADLGRTARSAAIGAAAGFALGAIYGQLRKTELWETLPAEKYHIHVAMTPCRGGIGLRFTMAM
jgi:hypothetical protein